MMKVNEGYMDSKSFFESPMGNDYDDPNTIQGANLALWAEGARFPAVWLTGPRPRWEPIDERTTVLFFPFESGEESINVRLYPGTGLGDNKKNGSHAIQGSKRSRQNSLDRERCQGK